MEYDVLAFIGRFQPFHKGHKAVVDEALRRAKKVALVIGSHDAPQTARNPFTTAQRISMVSKVYPNEVDSGRIHFVPQVDHVYSIERWRAGVMTGVTAVANTPFTPDPVKIGLIGHSKDHSSFYLKSFPTWGSVNVPNVDGYNATDIREKLFRTNQWSSAMPPQVQGYLRWWVGTEEFQKVRDEYQFLTDYKKQWEAAPYPPTFFTADTVVVQSGHVLLVRRGAQPGKGLWALPGGFVGRYETAREAAIRELKEEARISIGTETLDRCINMWRVFEDPYRSQRGRTITTAFRVELRADTELPRIKGSDDADKAQWVPISNLRRNALFEDHFDILETMIPF